MRHRQQSIGCLLHSLPDGLDDVLEYGKVEVLEVLRYSPSGIHGGSCGGKGEGVSRVSDLMALRFLRAP